MTVASFYARSILPRLIGCACAAGPIRRQREALVPMARGLVLELGIGGGLNLPFYNPRAVARVIGVDPSEGLRSRALAAPRAEGLAVEVMEGEAENLPFEDASFDTVVCTFTLCSVRSPAAALAEARRALRPGGRFLFCEHGLSPDPKVQRWQRRIEPFWTPLAGGCRLTREPGAAIAASGFSAPAMERFYLPGTPRAFGWCERGAAEVS